MSLKGDGPHHKMWLMSTPERNLGFNTPGRSRRHHEQGYALVALLAVMTVMAIFAVAAAPAIRQQAQREREREAIFRGEQVAEAIREFYRYQARTGRLGRPGLPTSMDQLLEGIPSGVTKKRQVLRPSAARDPLSDTGEWRLVAPASTETTDFTRAVILYSDNIRPTTRDSQLQAQEQDMVPFFVPGSSGPTGSPSSVTGNYSGPFIGTASSSTANSVIYYYGIGRHDGWVFTPFFR